MAEGQHVEGLLANGDALLFSVELRPGDFLRVRAEQHEVDTTLEVLAEDDGRVAWEDTDSGPDGPELLIYQAERAGIYRLRVAAIKGAGRLVLHVERAGAGTDADRALLEVRRLVAKCHEEPALLGRLDEAIEQLPAETPSLEVGRLWHVLGKILRGRDRLEEAFGALSRARERIAEHGNGWDLGPLLNDMTDVLLARGKLGESAPVLLESIRVSTGVGNDRALAVGWNNLGIWHAMRGELSPAIEAYTRAEALAESAGSSEIADLARSNLGVHHLALGRLEDGVEILRGREASLRAVAEPGPLGLTLASLAWGFDLLGESAAAEAHYDEAIELLGKAEAPHDQAIVFEQRAAFLLSHDRPMEALGDLERARKLAAPDPLQEAFFDLRTGEALIGLDRPQEALAPLDRAQSGFQELGGLHGRLATHVAAARALRELGKLDDARRELEGARGLAESMRRDLQVDAHRRDFFAARHEVFVELVDLLAQMNLRREAFEVAEGARARSLLDVLTAPEVAAEQTARTAEEQDLNMQRVQALRGGDEALAKRLAAEIRQRQIDLELAEEARLLSAGTHRVTATPLPAREVQRYLDDDTVMLAFMLGERRSWLWRVTRDEIRIDERPAREPIEKLARRAHELLGRSGRSGVEAATREALAALGKALFDGTDLERRRLAIVADGALHFVPFGVLPVPGGSGEEEDEVLLEKHEIVYLPSASTLVHLRRRLTERNLPSGLLAMLADPVFSASDDRVGSRRGSPVWRFRRLPASGEEARRILALAAGHETLARVGFAADRELLLGGELARFRWLHFATHALVDPRFPQQTGLVLSLVDRQGREQDGLLRPDQIAGLDLPAELVTLSACDTALGRQVRGEGLVGLAHAFFAAGASRLVASLWEVKDDEVTVRLMESFYRGLLAGRPPADSLRGAQLELHEEGVNSAYWAAFVLIGPWDPLSPIAPAGGKLIDGR